MEEGQGRRNMLAEWKGKTGREVCYPFSPPLSRSFLVLFPLAIDKKTNNNLRKLQG